MFDTKVRLNTVLTIAAALVMVLLSTSAFSTIDPKSVSAFDTKAVGIELETADPVPGGPGFVSVAGFEFLPESSENQYAIFMDDVVNTSATDKQYFYKQIQLPQGATIVRFILYYYDNMIGAKISANLRRRELGTATSLLLGNILSTDVGRGYGINESLDSSLTVVDNQSYIYYIDLYIECGVNELRLEGVRVDYSYPGYLPLTTR